MPRPPHALAREKARDALAFLSDVCTLDRKNKACPWKLSTEAFAGAPDDGDETPLDRVCYNEARRKYEYKNDDGSSVNEDDFILQAMVMLLLYRLEFGLGKQMAMQQLSVWKGSAKKPTKSTLPNLWEQDLIATGGPGRIWNRRSGSVRSVLHEFAEQSVVQWALELMKDKDFIDYPFLAASVVRIAAAQEAFLASCHLAELLHEAAVRSDSDTKSFSKLALDMMTRGCDYSEPPAPSAKRIKTC